MTLHEIDELTIPIPAAFLPYNRYEAVFVYHRNLPHWRQKGATYAVTFRTADSLPDSILKQIQSEAREWQEARKRAIGDPELARSQEEEFQSFVRRSHSLINSELDRGLGECVLRHPANRKLMEQTLRFFEGERYELFGFAIMPNHVHSLLKPLEDHSLESILKSWKAYSSRRIPSESEPLWQAESYDRIIRDENHFRSAARYILANPVKANLSPNEATACFRGIDPKNER